MLFIGKASFGGYLPGGIRRCRQKKQPDRPSGSPGKKPAWGKKMFECGIIKQSCLNQFLEITRIGCRGGCTSRASNNWRHTGTCWEFPVVGLKITNFGYAKIRPNYARLVTVRRKVGKNLIQTSKLGAEATNQGMSCTHAAFFSRCKPLHRPGTGAEILTPTPHPGSSSR